MLIETVKTKSSAKNDLKLNFALFTLETREEMALAKQNALKGKRQRLLN